MKIWFTDFWKGFDHNNHKFIKWIVDRLNLDVSSDNPDILFYAASEERNHLNYNCKKIFWSGENVRPDFTQCDLALTFDYLEDPRHLRLPLYSIEYWEYHHLRFKQTDIPSKFCAFIYGNVNTGVNQWGNIQDGVQKRIDLFHRLSSYKKVDSHGPGLNNTGTIIPFGHDNKINLLKE
jgi:hypothetical protein